MRNQVLRIRARGMLLASRDEAQTVLALEAPEMGENRMVALKPCSIRDANGCNSFSFSGRIMPPV